MQEEWIIVRDKKPELPGRLAHWSKRMVQDEQERNIYLAFKVGEEVAEFQEAIKKGDKDAALDELCDVYEIAAISLHEDWDVFCYRYPVIQDGIDLYGFTLRDIVDRADQKRFTHGGFTKGILLDTNTVET